ncbi:MAG: hypothetical protein ACON4P_06985 [Candidatus Puniceispirillales bacterium]
MGWLRWKKKGRDTDQIFDLDDVVWRGVDRMQRLDRLAEDADRIADHHQDSPEQPPVYAPKHPISLIDEVINASTPGDWAETDDRDIADDRDDPAGEPGLASSPPVDPEPEETPPQEASIDMISDAVEAVLASDAVAASVRAEALGHDDAPQAASPVEPPLSPAVPLGLDMKSAVEQVVREELSGWLQQNMGKIIAEAMPEKPVTADVGDTAPKTAAKPATKPAAKKKKAATKPKSPVKKRRPAARKATPAASRENIIPLKGRDKSS